MTDKPIHVAIIGGGLCGLSLAIALTKRNIPYTIYEARTSFTEIGAGINLGPNTIEAFNLIDSALKDEIFALATRNPEGHRKTWMNVRLGAPTERFKDAKLVTGIQAPLTGNMTVSRNELLQLLARSTKEGNAKFEKKIARIEQNRSGVTLGFEDGTVESASVVIGCDGAHSTVRRLLLGEDNPAAKPQFSQTGGYRAIFPMGVQEQLVGAEQARMSTIRVGPGGYVIHYPINGGKDVNVGLWPWRLGDWEQESWVIRNQKPAMLKDFEAWGPALQKVMQEIGDDTAFWATFHHSVKPQQYYKGRVCLIGDASHAMCPHQGQGAAQSMEDAFVMAEVLNNMDFINSKNEMAEQIEAAFEGYESVRKPRFENAIDTSFEAHSFWADFWRPDLSEEDLREFEVRAQERFEWLWNPDIFGQSERARRTMDSLLLG